MSEQDEVAGQLLAMGEYTLLLPNGVVAEILRQVALDPENGAPEWVLGTFFWQGQRVPLVSFLQLTGLASSPPEGRKCVIVKTLDTDASFSCYAIHIDSFPQFVSLARHGLLLDAANDQQPHGVRTAVLVGGKSALVPDLDYIEESLGQWLGQA